MYTTTGTYYSFKKTVCCPGWIGIQPRQRTAVLLLILMFYVLFMCKCVLSPGVNPTAVDKYIDININPTRTDSHLKRTVSTNCCIYNTVVPPDDGPRYARNM
jgi:hypothetical protein